jgi:hypothetical protein
VILATQRHQEVEADQSRVLSAGAVSAILSESGTSLRDVAFNGEVILRGLSFVARDENWGTLPLAATPQIRSSAQFIEVEASGEGTYANGDLTWQVLFRITPSGVEARAKVQSKDGFLTNRTGIVVLHGLSACRGQEVLVTHSDGSATTSSFPVTISPHQPFMDMAAMVHRTTGGTRVQIAFEGEVFEAEDQRNWTDASYKTYSRPLDWPFPYRIEAGETVEQSVRVSFNAGAASRTSPETEPRVQADAVLPRFATGQPVNRAVSDAVIIKALNNMGFAAIALEIDPEGNGWLEQLARHLASIDGDIRLNCRMTSDTNHASVLAAIEEVLAGRKPVGISLWGGTDEAVAFARSLWRDVPIGGGTGAFFAEFNRGTLPTGIDYATWTTNPTVHASDNDTLGESIEPLRDVLATAQAKAPNLDLVVGPLTLIMRFNPNATSAEARRVEPEPDPRQHTVLTASWLIGTIAGFVDPVVKELIVFEVAGPKGLILPDGTLSPSGHVMARLAPLSGSRAQVVTWAHEPRSRGLLVHTPHGRILIVTQAKATVASLMLPEGSWGAPEHLTSEGFAVGGASPADAIEVDGFGVVWVAETK